MAKQPHKKATKHKSKAMAQHNRTASISYANFLTPNNKYYVSGKADMRGASPGTRPHSLHGTSSPTATEHLQGLLKARHDALPRDDCLRDN